MTASVNHYEDFALGRRFAHHWGRTIHEAEATSFAAEYLIHQPQHFNREYALHLGYQDIVVPGVLVFAIALGLSVEDLSESGGPFLGADEIAIVAEAFKPQGTQALGAANIAELAAWTTIANVVMNLDEFLMRR